MTGSGSAGPAGSAPAAGPGPIAAGAIGASSAMLVERVDISSTSPPISRNGSFGMPGIRHSASSAPPPIRSASRCRSTCATRSAPTSLSLVERVTMTPVATEVRSAGICETRPSPTVSRLYVLIASPGDSPRCSMPTAKPPIRLTNVMMMAAIASPLTNFVPPSIAP